MAERTISKTVGHFLKGALVRIQSMLIFNNIGDPLFDTTAGTMLWHLQTAVANAFRFRDDTKGQDILSIDTNNDEVNFFYPVKGTTIFMNLNVLLGAAKTHYLAMPSGATLERIETVVFSTTATNPETIVTKNNADTIITNGTVTIVTGAIAKEVDTASPTANNTFLAGEVLTIEVGGENTNAVECEITFKLKL